MSEKSFFYLFLTLTLAFLSPVPHSSAQSPAATQNAQAALEQFQNQNYKAAADAYEQLIKDFPTDLVVAPAQIQLAYSALFMGEYDRALAALEQFAKNPVSSPELKEVAANLLPQVLSSKAASLKTDDPKRKTTYEEAVKKYTDFLKKFPSSKDVESATYGRALANFQLEKYDEAITDLEENLKKFASSPTILDSQNLYALTLATQGSLELAKGESANKAEAFAKYDKASQLLEEIIKKKSDLTLVNSAHFQLGEILFNRSGFSEENIKPELFNKALKAFRSVQPKDELVTLQKERLEAFPTRRREALKSGNTEEVKRLDKEQIRESGKLAELEGRPDQTLTAILRSGEVFYAENRYDESRTLFKHLSPFLTDEEQKKKALYFETMTYALQNAADKAVASYQAFKEAYKNDPIAQNLPLMMGIMFLGTSNPIDNSPEKAITYFDESIAAYPEGRFLGQSLVQKATAQTRLQQYEEALKTFQNFLSKNPPADIGVIAQKGTADIYKDTQRWDDAIAAYKTVIEKYAQFAPQVEESTYWIAVCTNQKNDYAASIPLLKGFLEKYPESVLAPNALYVLATAQTASQKIDEGIATLTKLAEEFPESQPAPFTYFMRAQLLHQKEDAAGADALMKAFIEKYPQDNKVFFAYEALATSAQSEGKNEEPARLYLEFAEKYPSDPQAATALVRASEFQRRLAESMGRYGALNVDEREPWKGHVDDSISTLENLIAAHPESPQLAEGIQSLLTSQRLLLGAGIKTPEEIESYFDRLAEEQNSNQAKSKIQFALAGFIAENNPDRALEKMQTAFDPTVIYAPEDLDTFGLALIKKKNFELADQVFEKAGTDYPIPEGVPHDQAERIVQEAQAIRLFGKGRIAQEQGKTDEAAQFFTQLNTEYGWSPKVLEARYGIAESQYKTEPDTALASLAQIIRDPRASAELRAKSMLLFGYIYKQKAESAATPEDRAEALATAIDNFLKIAQYYSGVPTIAAEGLWEGAQLLEVQIAGITDPQEKTRQIGVARQTYQDLISNFANSPYTDRAKEKLARLPEK